MNKNEIGSNAGIIFHLIEAKGPLSYDQIKEFTNLDIPEIMLALGWLSRENKIGFCSNQKENVVGLCQSDFYF